MSSAPPRPRLATSLVTALVAAAASVPSIAPSVAFGHAGQPAVAYLDAPQGVGVVVDTEFVLTWSDADAPIPTGTATVDLFYTQQRPMTFVEGVIPDDLTGAPIVTGLLEADLDNRFVWDVTGVPAGSYHVWSRVNDPPDEEDALQIIHFAPGVVTVAHPGDPVHPAVLVTAPANLFEFADEEFVVRYRAFDPDGTGRVRIEGAWLPPDDQPVFEVLAENLPADADGSWLWPTATLAEGDWVVRVTVEDDRGLSFTTYAPTYLFITHPGSVPVGPDAGRLADGGAGDAAAGSPPPPSPSASSSSSDCRCTQPSSGASGAGVTVLLAGLAVLWWRRQPAA